MKPKVFIGSSREGIPIANALHVNLTREAECTVWKDGVFNPSSVTLNDLIRVLRSSDFGIFVFSPDDIATIRDNTDPVVRDNVLFELGLFVGRLGIERCYFLIPDNCKDLHLPTDLLGVTPGTYEGTRSDKNWTAAVNPFCVFFIQKLLDLKSFQDAASAIASITHPPTPSSPKLTKPAAASAAPTSTATKDLWLEEDGNTFQIKGDTLKHKDRIKALGIASWHKTKKVWYFGKSRESMVRAELSDILK